MNKEIIIKNITSRFRDFKDQLIRYEKDCSEIVLFGSCVSECFTTDSDVDILLVGENKERRNKQFNPVWLSQKKTYSKTWLMSDLASHISKYGVWVKGDGLWKDQVFFSNAFAKIKQQRILQRLLHVCLNKEQLTKRQKIILIKKVVSQSYRLFLYKNKEPQIVKQELIRRIIDNREMFYYDLFSDEILGELGCFFFAEIFSKDKKLDVYNAIVDLILSDKKELEDNKTETHKKAFHLNLSTLRF